MLTVSCLSLQIANYVKVSDALETFDVEERALHSLEGAHPGRVRVVHGTVKCIDADAHVAHLDDGGTIPFDKICLCCGAIPRVLVDHPCVVGLRDTESITALADRLLTARRVLVLGNGGIALGLVHEIRSCPVVWAVKDAYIGSTFFDASASHFLLSLPQGPHSEREDGAADAGEHHGVVPPAAMEEPGFHMKPIVPLHSGSSGSTRTAADSASGASGVAADDAVALSGAVNFSHSPTASTSMIDATMATSAAAEAQHHRAAASVAAKPAASEDDAIASVPAAAAAAAAAARKDISAYVPLPPRVRTDKTARKRAREGAAAQADAADSDSDRTGVADQPMEHATAATAATATATAVLPALPAVALPLHVPAASTSSRHYGSSLGPSWLCTLRDIESRRSRRSRRAEVTHSEGRDASAGTSESASSADVKAGVSLMTGVEVVALRGVGAGAVGVLADSLWHAVLDSSGGVEPLPLSPQPRTTDTDDILTHSGRLSSSPWPLYVLFSNGCVVGCDVLVSATGITPATHMLPWPQSQAQERPLPGTPQFLRHSDGGLLVNDSMQCSGSPDVYAAGDAASVLWPRARVLQDNVQRTGSTDPLHPAARFPLWFQMRLWNQARTQGAYAARCMAEARDPLELEGGGFTFELFAHMFRFCGLKVVLLGAYNGQGLGEAYERALREQLVRVQAGATDGGATAGASAAAAAVTTSTSLAGGTAPGGTDLVRGTGPVSVQLRITPGAEYVKIVTLHGRVVGALLIGDTDLEETFENLILNRLDMRTQKEGRKKRKRASGAGGVDTAGGSGSSSGTSTGPLMDLLDPDVDLEDYFD